MVIQRSDSVWSIKDAKSRLSKILRLARNKEPQFIGRRDQCVVVSREEWEARNTEEESALSSWLLTHSPAVEFEIPPRGTNAKNNPWD